MPPLRTWLTPKVRSPTHHILLITQALHRKAQFCASWSLSLFLSVGGDDRRLAMHPCTSRGVLPEFVCRYCKYCTDVIYTVSDSKGEARWEEISDNYSLLLQACDLATYSPAWGASLWRSTTQMQRCAFADAQCLRTALMSGMRLGKSMISNQSEASSTYLLQCHCVPDTESHGLLHSCRNFRLESMRVEAGTKLILASMLQLSNRGVQSLEIIAPLPL